MTKNEAIKQELDLLEKLGNQILDLSDTYIKLLTLEELKKKECGRADDIMEMHNLQQKMFEIARARLHRVSPNNY